MTSEETNTMKGFAGLNDLVSDVSSETEADIGVSSLSANQPESSKASEPLPNIETNYRTPSVSYAPLVGKVLLGAFILFVIWGISQSNSSHPSSSPDYTASTTADYNTTVETPETVDSYAEDIPPAMMGMTLTKNQVQYCVSQNIRVSQIQTTLNSYSDLEINKFNQLVEDYNSRCSHYYYRDGALEQAQADASAHNAQLEREAQALLEQWRQEETTNAETNTKIQTAVAQPTTPPPPVPVTYSPKPENNYIVPVTEAPISRDSEDLEPVQTDLDSTSAPESSNSEKE